MDDLDLVIKVLKAHDLGNINPNKLWAAVSAQHNSQWYPVPEEQGEIWSLIQQALNTSISEYLYKD